VERCRVCTWVVDKFLTDVEMGYCQVDVFQFCVNLVTWFDKDTNTGVLFVEYVDMFLKLKQLPHGYPSRVQSVEGKEIYILNYRRADGIPVDKVSISKNAGQLTLEIDN